MADFTVITDTQVDPDAPLTSGLGYAFRDNPLAIAEGSLNAPYALWAWHPHNGVKWGDGFDGKFYDHANNGSVANVVTPNFVDGFEYRVRIEALDRVGTPTLAVELFSETSSTYTTARTVSPNASTDNLWGTVEFQRPRIASTFFNVVSNVSVQSGTGSPMEWSGSGFVIASTKILRARLSWTPAVNITGGRMYLERRKVA